LVLIKNIRDDFFIPIIFLLDTQIIYMLKCKTIQREDE